MSTPPSKPSTAVVVCLTVVAVTAIGAVAGLVLADAETDKVVVVVGLVGTMVTALVGLTRTEQIKKTVDDLSNGRMDAKIRAGVADVLADHLIDQGATQQIEADRARRADGGA